MRKILTAKLTILAVGFSLLFFINNTCFAEEESFDFLDQQKINSHLIANMFMENVDQGRISIFGHVLKRAELEQQNVAYIHNFKDNSVSICIRIKIKERFPVPNFENYYVEAISVDVDEVGKIEQVRSHIKPYKE